MRIAAFDLGQHTAVAHNLYGEDVRTNHIDAKGDRVQRAGEISVWLRTFFTQAMALGGLDAVLYERPFARGQHATRSLWGVAGLIEAAAGEHNIPCLDYAPSEIKKHAIGRGDADKDDMMLAASMTGYMGDNEHEADAWCLLRFAEDTIKPAKPQKPQRKKK